MPSEVAEKRKRSNNDSMSSLDAVIGEVVSFYSAHSWLDTFGWCSIDGISLPVIMRKGVSYVSVRMVVLKLLWPFADQFNVHMMLHDQQLPLRSVRAIEDECRLMNEINYEHCLGEYGLTEFTQADFLVPLVELMKFYTSANAKHHASHRGTERYSEQDFRENNVSGGWLHIDNVPIPYIRRHNLCLVPLTFLSQLRRRIVDYTEKWRPSLIECAFMSKLCQDSKFDCILGRDTLLLSSNVIKHITGLTITEFVSPHSTCHNVADFVDSRHTPPLQSTENFASENQLCCNRNSASTEPSSQSTADLLPQLRQAARKRVNRRKRRLPPLEAEFERSGAECASIDTPQSRSTDPGIHTSDEEAPDRLSAARVASTCHSVDIPFVSDVIESKTVDSHGICMLFGRLKLDNVHKRPPVSLSYVRLRHLETDSSDAVYYILLEDLHTLLFGAWSLHVLKRQLGSTTRLIACNRGHGLLWRHFNSAAIDGGTEQSIHLLRLNDLLPLLMNLLAIYDMPCTSPASLKDRSVPMLRPPQSVDQYTPYALSESPLTCASNDDDL